MCAASAAYAGTATKQATGTDLTGNTAGVWSGGSGANGSPNLADVATWSSSSLGPGLTLGTSEAWGSISISGATADIAITGAGTLTVGAIGLTNVNMSIGNPIILGGNPTWRVGTSGKKLTVSGTISGSSQTLTVAAGNGTVALTGSNSISGNITISSGTLTLSGTNNFGSPVIVANVSNTVSVLNISGAVNASGTGGSFNTGSLVAGDALNAVGVINVLSGAVLLSSHDIQMGVATTGTSTLGVLNMSGGIVNVGGYVSVIRAQTGGGTAGTGGLSRGELIISGGILTQSNNVFDVGGDYNNTKSLTGVGILSGGTINLGTSASSSTVPMYAGEWGNGTINLLGSTVNILGANANAGLFLSRGSSGAGIAGATDIVNSVSGVLTTYNVAKGTAATALGIYNFEGGTLKANANNPSFMTGLTAANVYPGGAIIDDGGYAITVGQPLVAPAGNGVTIGSLVATNNGFTFAALPVVDINGGGGVGASAIAQIDGNGNLTSILITCPGTGYTSVPTVSFTYGTNTVTTSGTLALTANTTGGLTKQGSGTLNLTGTNTYTGSTTIKAGTLGGNGIISGVVTNSANGTLQPGLGNGDTSTLTVSNNVALLGANYFWLNRANAQNSSLLLATGTVKLGGTLTVTNGGAALQAGDSFTLINATGYSGSFSATNLPTLNYGLAWTNTIGFNGIISVISYTPTPTNAMVTNLPASQIFATSATLNGQVLSIGSQVPNVWIYYGSNNGGTNAANWSNSIALGAENGTFTALAAGLTTNTTYYFTAFASNSVGVSWASPSQSFTTLASNPSAVHVPVLTYHYDNTRQGQNTNETLLTPANVNTNTFGKLFSYVVDGHVYAQPLIMTNVAIPGQGVHNVVFVATENDMVYAFDADSNAGANGGLLWSNKLGVASTNSISPYGSDYGGGAFGSYGNIQTEVGVTATPVIDPVTKTLFVDGFTREYSAGPPKTTNYVHRIHALDITTGNEQPNSPVVVAGSVPGVGVDSVGGVMTFNPVQELQRTALALAGGKLFVAYTSYADTDPFHGWIFAYNATNLTLPPSVFCTTPNATSADFPLNGKSQAGEGGIWQGGAGLAVDENTNLYFETGNGSFSAFTNGGDYGDSFVKLSTTSGLAVADYYTPYDQNNRAFVDTDLGSGGPTLLPGSVGNGTNLLVGLDKGGKVFVLNRDKLASPNYQTSAGANLETNVLQVFQPVSQTFFSSPTYFNGMIYVQASSSGMKQFSVANGSVNTSPVATATGFGGSVGGPVVSANGTNNGIVWGINAGNPAVLYALNATNISQTLYTSSQLATRDKPGNAVKFTTPIVAGGKVYVGSQFTLTVYGGGQVFLDAPIISPNGGSFMNSVNISMSDASAGVYIYYTLDGTTPTTSSTLYTNSFMLTSNAVVRAIATAPGSADSAVASASFINTAAAGTGTGLRAEYFANATSASPFSGSPVLVTTNATVNFSSVTNWPGSLVGSNNFTVRWTGSVQPQFTENYSFITTADDGVRLFINGQLLIDDWVDKTSATSQTNTISLVAQQYYTIEMDYYQKSNTASATLSWSSPSTPFNVVPQLQLYPFTNPPPSVVLTAPSSGASYTAIASVTISADADATYNPISMVNFYTNNVFLGSVTNLPYKLTATGLGAGGYALTAVAVDGSGLNSTSAAVNITVDPGSGQSYGLATSPAVPAFFNMPTTFSGSLPALLSLTGVFSNTPSMTPVSGLIPYTPNTPLWSDGALKVRYLAVPNNGGVITPGEQITFAPTGSWTFPAGTVFVKTFQLNTDTSNPNVIHRLETRLLVRDINGQVYGVTYKWRPDNSDADLLTSSLSENITITNAGGNTTQTWYYPSPSDCLTCHTPVANYVLGVNTRQLNASLAYPATGVTDNQLRALNHLGLFNPAFDEGSINSFSKMSALTNLTASLEDRSRSYFDANCSQCHQPGGAGPGFDARYDTPLANQNLINGGLDANGFAMIAPHDPWRSKVLARMNTTSTGLMPPLARSIIDSNAVQVVTDWINSLPGSPVRFLSVGFNPNQQFQLNFLGVPSTNYVLQASTNLLTWVPISTNIATLNPILLIDSTSTNFSKRFYRALQQ